jgi:nicotinamide riboside kinase
VDTAIALSASDVSQALESTTLVCVIGAECTGKTRLTQALARHFSGLFVPEYLRAFCSDRGRTPDREEQSLILQTQVQYEETSWAQARSQSMHHVFCDGAALLTAIYSQHYFADSSLLTRARALHQRYALTLLLEPDVPWVADGFVRDGEQVQAAVHSLLLAELLGRYACVRIRGTGALRLQAAVQAVQAIAH